MAIRNAGRFCAGWVTAAPLTGRRFVVLAAFVLLYPVFAIVTGCGLLMDEIFFRGYKRQGVESPLFIVGNFRSGTTFLHRLLARDEERFATLHLWEILFAPSLSARWFLMHCQRLHQWLGSPLSGWLGSLENGWARQNPSHKISFFEPEEDDYLMLHLFSSLTVGLSAGLPDQANPYVFFDQSFAAREKKRLMKFYRRCLQKFLWARGRGRQYLAKAPALTPKLRSLAEEFPDAKFVVIVRDPREVVPSVSSMMRMTWRSLGVPDDSEKLRAFLLGMARHWYVYPGEVGLPAERIAFIRYEQLVADPGAVIGGIYRRFNMPLGKAFELVLRAESARTFSSRHEYSIRQEGFDVEDLNRLATSLESLNCEI